MGWGEYPLARDPVEQKIVLNSLREFYNTAC